MVFKGEIKLNSAKMPCKGGRSQPVSAFTAAPTEKRERRKEGGCISKVRALFPNRGAAKKPPSPNQTQPLGPCALSRPWVTAVLPAPEPPPCPWKRVPGEGGPRESPGQGREG